MQEIFFIHFFLCSFMTGLIWLVQLVHYPAFLFVEKKRIKEFELFHAKRISLIVMPVMILELASAMALVYYLPSFLLYVNLGALLLIWLSTFLLSVPCHEHLAKTDMNETSLIEKIQRLVKTNWPRTILWTLRSIVLLASLASLF